MNAQAISLLLGFMDRAMQVGMLMKNAKDEGRDVTTEELQAFIDADAVARQNLQDIIDKAKSQS